MKRDHVLLVAAAAVFSAANMTFIRRARIDYPLFLYGLMQTTAVAAVMFSLVMRRTGLKSIRDAGGDLRAALAIGIVSCGVTTLNFLGYGGSTATEAAALQRSDVLFTLLIGWTLFRERFKPLDIPYIVVLIAGTLVVLDFDPARFSVGNPYNLCFVGAALGMSVNAFLAKYGVKKLAWFELAFVNVSIQSIYYIVAVSFFVRDKSLAALVAKPATSLWVAGAAAALAVYLMMFYKSLRLMPVWIVRALLLSIPLFTTVFEAILFGDIPTVKRVAGIVLVTAGVLGLTLSERENASGQAENAGK